MVQYSHTNEGIALVLERVGRFDLYYVPGHTELFVRGEPRRRGGHFDFDILAFTTHPDGTVTWNERHFPLDMDPTPAEICDIIAACARYGYRAPKEPPKERATNDHVQSRILHCLRSLWRNLFRRG